MKREYDGVYDVYVDLYPCIWRGLAWRGVGDGNGNRSILQRHLVHDVHDDDEGFSAVLTGVVEASLVSNLPFSDSQM